MYKMAQNGLYPFIIAVIVPSFIINYLIAKVMVRKIDNLLKAYNTVA